MSPPRPRAGGRERAPEMDSAPARVSAAAGIFLAPPRGVHPRISVVIVVSGSPQPLMRCLDALEQCRDRVALEAIVVDHSPDDACEWSTMMASRATRRSEEHTSELQSRENLVCRLLLVKNKHL